MKNDKAKRATSVKNAPRMTPAETPAAAVAPMATVATAAPKRAGTAAKGPGPVRAAAKEAPRAAVAKAAVSPPKPSSSKAAVAKAPAFTPRPGVERVKALPLAAAQAASTALQSALRDRIPTGGVIPSADAALAPLSAALETGAEQARVAYGRARATGDTLQQALTQSASAAARGLLEVNETVLDGMRAQSDAAFDFWRSTLTAGSLSEFVRIQTSGLRRAYELTSAQAKDVASATARAVGETVKPLQSAITPRH